MRSTQVLCVKLYRFVIDFIETVLLYDSRGCSSKHRIGGSVTRQFSVSTPDHHTP